MIGNRFYDLPWNKEQLEVLIGGAGGIGSWLTLFLSRIGHDIYLFDDDRVEEVNLGGQLFSKENIGYKKSEAIKFNCKAFNSFDTVNNQGWYEYPDALPFMFSCFDNMKSRKDMFQAWKESSESELFIDGRMLAEQMDIFCMSKDDSDHISRYENEFLFDDSEVEDQPCSARATSHCGAMIASYMTSLFTNYLTNKYMKHQTRDVPFRLKIDLPILMQTIDYNEPSVSLT